MISAQYLSRVALKTELIERTDEYPLSLPVLRNFDYVDLHPKVTFLVGENGSGKSTLLEAIAVAFGFNAEGGTKNFDFSTRESHSELHQLLRISTGAKKPRDGFFLRAESFYNVATAIDALDVAHAYGGVSLHEQSHGESFLSLMHHRFGGQGLYLLDEPEAALSPARQLKALARMHELIGERSQFIIATHSPIFMAYPDAWIYACTPDGLKKVTFRDTEHFRVMSDFFGNPEQVVKDALKAKPETINLQKSRKESALRIAIAQQEMFWTTEENTAQIVKSLDIAKANHAELCVFPELAITGFHRNIREEADPQRVAAALQRVQSVCGELGIAAVVGIPTFGSGEKRFNSVVFIDQAGELVEAIDKVGLTLAEETFFTAGGSRAITSLIEKRCSAVICREINDVELLKVGLSENAVDLIFWPGIMRPDPLRVSRSEPHIEDARTLATHTGAYVIQSNWPNSLNYPEESAESGHSIVIAPSGETLFRLPKARSGIGVFALGQTHFDWISA